MGGSRFQAPAVAITEHLLVISIDGLRPDAIPKAEAPILQGLLRDGATARVARTILPSTTLPSHTSMLTGLEPADHGVVWNSNEDDPWGTVTVPTVFDLAHEHGLRTAAFFAKSKLGYLRRKGSFDYISVPGRWGSNRLAGQTVRGVEKYLEKNAPHLLFVHFGETDYAGHADGWMTKRYLGAVAEADRGLGRVLAAANRAFGPAGYTLIVTADHGGHRRVHGSDDPEDVLIPWMVWGRGVEAGAIVPDTVRTTDTAATILWLLGVPVPSTWSGAPRIEAFTAAAREHAALTAPPP